MTTKHIQIRIVIILGLLAALVSNLNFTIPVVGSLTSDPREIVALAAIFFLTNWRSALVLGLLAGLGGPYNDTLWVTVLLHAVGIPLGFFLYQQIRKQFSHKWFISIMWLVLVAFIYAFVYSGIFILTHYLMGEFPTVIIIDKYLSVLMAIKYEALITMAITVLILQVKLAREDSHLNEELLSLIMKTNSFGIWEWWVEQDQLVVNDDLARMLKYKVPDFGKKIEDLKNKIHPTDLEKVNIQLSNLMKNEIQQLMLEYRLKSGDGNWNCVLGTATVVQRDDLNRAVHLIGTVMDITVLKQAEQENAKLREQLTQVQKMEAIGTLAGGIAHDFNNLLTVINGHAEMAGMRVEENTPVHRDVVAIHSAGKKAARLTSQLLAFSRKQVYKAEVLDVNAIVTDLNKMQRRLIGEDIEIEIVLNENLPKVKGDPSQIEQIILNLLVNARDAISAKTNIAAEKKITIETSFKDFDQTYVSQNAYVTPGNYIVLAISDNGIGMDSVTRQKIFEPFYTTKEMGKGTGLGLSTVYGIVKQNKGFISVYSEPDQGTTFKIYWPVSGDQVAKARELHKHNADDRGTEQILLVEDDTAVRNFAETALKAKGYEVVATADGQEAYEALKSQNMHPILLITDLIMPRMNGRELAKKVLAELPDCKVLYASGYTDNHIVHEGSLEKGLNFIQKPYSINELTFRVRELIDQE